MQNNIAKRHPGNLDHISVCICTYKRTELLASLLAALEGQKTDDHFDFSVVVVDNDRTKSAESTILAFKNKLAFSVEYYAEPEQNIALARNTAIRNSKGNLIAFIDDDEIPDNDWLYALHCALRRYAADGVLGPVFPYFRTPPPQWVIRGKFYQRPTYDTGFVIDWRKGRTGNILLKRTMFETSGEMFDPRFGSGAEDQDFVRRMIKKKHVFVWCNEARAHEYVPPIRWSRIFMIKRALLRGKPTLANPESGISTILKSCMVIPFYTLALPVLFLLGHHWFVKYLIKDFDHLGRILALLKINPIKQIYIVE
jgi:glycosyltransferase involved in cell wall biosynthesis